MSRRRFPFWATGQVDAAMSSPLPPPGDEGAGPSLPISMNNLQSDVQSESGSGPHAGSNDPLYDSKQMQHVEPPDPTCQGKLAFSSLTNRNDYRTSHALMPSPSTASRGTQHIGPPSTASSIHNSTLHHVMHCLTYAPHKYVTPEV